MTTLLLCFTMATSPVYAQRKAYPVSYPPPRLIDNGKRWKQTIWYSDGTRKVFIVEIPKLR